MTYFGQMFVLVNLETSTHFICAGNLILTLEWHGAILKQIKEKELLMGLMELSSILYMNCY